MLSRGRCIIWLRGDLKRNFYIPACLQQFVCDRHIVVKTGSAPVVNRQTTCHVIASTWMYCTGVYGAAGILPAGLLLKCTLFPFLAGLSGNGCEVRSTQEMQALFAGICLALDEDWHTECLGAIIPAELVDDADEAIDHINSHSSRYTEAVIAQDLQVIEKFFNHIDSVIPVHNVSTQFADGEEFGFDAGINVATGEIHAHGLIGTELLASFKYRISGSGQTRA